MWSWVLDLLHYKMRTATHFVLLSVTRFQFISEYLFITFMCCRLLVMRQGMKIQRQMTCPVLHHYLPFPCCRPKPWRRQAASSNLNRNNEKRPRSDTKILNYATRSLIFCLLIFFFLLITSWCLWCIYDFLRMKMSYRRDIRHLDFAESYLKLLYKNLINSTFCSEFLDS